MRANRYAYTATRAHCLIDADRFFFAQGLYRRAFKLFAAEVASLARLGNADLAADIRFWLPAVHKAGPSGYHNGYSAIFLSRMFSG